MKLVLARMLCKIAHSGQERKYTGQPYYTHPFEVERLVDNAGLGTTARIVALLHDVVEDTRVPLWLISLLFGQKVAMLVEQVTDVSKPTDGARAIRKRIDLLHIAGACSLAKSIKLADLISNASTIERHDPSFAKVYMAEKLNLLEVLKTGDRGLYLKATGIVERYYASKHGERAI